MNKCLFNFLFWRGVGVNCWNDPAAPKAGHREAVPCTSWGAGAPCNIRCGITGGNVPVGFQWEGPGELLGIYKVSSVIRIKQY